MYKQFIKTSIAFLVFSSVSIASTNELDRRESRRRYARGELDKITEVTRPLAALTCWIPGVNLVTVGLAALAEVGRAEVHAITHLEAFHDTGSGDDLGRAVASIGLGVASYASGITGILDAPTEMPLSVLDGMSTIVGASSRPSVVLNALAQKRQRDDDEEKAKLAEEEKAAELAKLEADAKAAAATEHLESIRRKRRK